MDDSISVAARTLDSARLHREAIGQGALGALADVTQAYAVARQGIALRVGRGERICGIKMGFTSRAKMAQMGVSEMIVGQLTDAMRIEDGGTVHSAQLIHPRIEPEIAFLLSRELAPGFAADDLVRSVDAVAPAMEVIDSRYRDFRFDLAAVVADNTSAAAFVVGTWHGLHRSIANLGLCMRVNGGAGTTGSTAAILGDPWRALAAAATLASRYGLEIPAGSIVLAGAATAAEALPREGFVETEMAGLGRVQLRIEAQP